MKNNTLVSVGIIIAALLILVFGWKYWNDRPVERPDLDSFARCLAAEEFTMYGAEWCPHCKREKARFGTAWQYVPYVECPENTKLCLDKGIKGYPTWIGKDGKKYEGEQGLERISELSGCPLPR